MFRSAQWPSTGRTIPKTYTKEWDIKNEKVIHPSSIVSIPFKRTKSWSEASSSFNVKELKNYDDYMGKCFIVLTHCNTSMR
jgi:hypothetical protein